MKTSLPVSNGRLFSKFHLRPPIPAGGIVAFLLFLLTLAGGGQALGQNCYNIICPPDQTNWVCASTQTVPASGYPTVITNCPPPLPPITIACNIAPGTPLGPGTHNVTCTYSVGGVPPITCTFRIHVFLDTVPPVITCPTNMVVPGCSATACGAIVNYPAPVASDNSGSVTVTCAPPSGSFFPCGINPVTCTAEDRCNNKSVCQFNITVQQGGQPPIITCPSNIVVETCSNCTVVAYPMPTVINGTLVSCTPPPTFCFPLTTTPVVCTAVNPCGTNTCTFTVTVRPVPPVSITCPTNVVIPLPCSSNCAAIFYPMPVVANGTLVSCTPPAGTCLSPGIYNVLCMATNDCGQLRECTFQVRIVAGQGEPPSITCPPDMDVTTCSNNCAVVTYPPPVVVNGFLGGCVPPSGFCFPVGLTTTVTCLAVNPCGTNACSFKVTVRKVPPPTISCPSNIVVTLPCGSNCVPVSYSPTVFNGTLLGCNPPSGTCFPVGLFNVICRATNICGEVAGCEFEVRVLQGQGHGPVLDCPQEIVVSTCNTNCQVVNYPAPVVMNGVLVSCTPPSGFCFPVGVTTTGPASPPIRAGRPRASSRSRSARSPRSASSARATSSCRPATPARS
jgi:hypothetical protein